MGCQQPRQARESASLHCCLPCVRACRTKESPWEDLLPWAWLLQISYLSILIFFSSPPWVSRCFLPPQHFKVPLSFQALYHVLVIRTRTLLSCPVVRCRACGQSQIYDDAETLGGRKASAFLPQTAAFRDHSTRLAEKKTALIETML